jgi:hypothetical protein
MDPLKTFLICSIRDASEEEKARLKKIVKEIERTEPGYEVYYPLWHTDQDGDPIGLRICTDNRRPIMEGDMVHINYSPVSRGSLFDLGMSYAASKELNFFNHDEFEGQDSEVLRFLSAYASNVDSDLESELLTDIGYKLRSMRRKKTWEITWNGELKPEFLMELGSAFMTKGLWERDGKRKYITLTNPDDVEVTTKTDKDGNKVLDEDGNEILQKSFNNVLLALTHEYNQESRKILEMPQRITELDSYLDLSAYVQDCATVPA